MDFVYICKLLKSITITVKYVYFCRCKTVPWYIALFLIESLGTDISFVLGKDQAI